MLEKDRVLRRKSCEKRHKKKRMVIVTAHYEPGKDRYSMRLNGKRIVEVMEEKSLTEETVCSRTGLYSEVFPVDCKRGLCIRGRSGTDSGCSRPDGGGNPAAGNHWKCGECD